MSKIRIGTRGSALALWQANFVKAALESHKIEAVIIEISTRGDQIQQGPIAEIGSQGVFTKEIQCSLQRREIDIAVHSLKDLPTELVDGLQLAATPKRGSWRDAFLSNHAETIDQLPNGSIIGTGSVRRKSQIMNFYGEKYKIIDIRGNVDTRLKKLDAGDYDAIILAESGLVRLGFESRIRSFLEPPMFLPAVGQGAIGLECRANDPVIELVQKINDVETFAATTAERSLLFTLRGGCLAPVAALGTVEKNLLTLYARVLSPDGRMMLETEQSGNMTDATAIGQRAGKILLEQGAEKIMRM